MFIRNSLRPDHLAGFDLEEIDSIRDYTQKWVNNEQQKYDW